MACFLLVTFPPFPCLPERSVPCFLRRMALRTLFPAALPYLAILHSLDKNIFKASACDDSEAADQTISCDQLSVASNRSSISMSFLALSSAAPGVEPFTSQLTSCLRSSSAESNRRPHFEQIFSACFTPVVVISPPRMNLTIKLLLRPRS